MRSQAPTPECGPRPSPTPSPSLLLSESRRIAAIEDGLDQWRQGTCLNFVKDGSGTDSLNFIIDGGCYSYVGRIGGAQPISIGDGCEYPGIVAHEVGHAVGAWHEQSRPDRDSYVQVNIGNVRSGLEGNFQKAPFGTTNDRGVSYDFGSVMHYGPKAFSANGQPTIEALPAYSLYDSTMGQREELSFADIKQMNLRYCADQCNRQLSCSNGGYTDPKACGRCRCPPGFSGTLCHRVESASCGGQRSATAVWQTISSSGSNCVFLLKASGGGRVQLQFTQLSYSGGSTCRGNFVEVKATENFDITGARLCGSTPDRITSDTHQIVLIHQGRGSFTAQFRQGR